MRCYDGTLPKRPASERLQRLVRGIAENPQDIVTDGSRLLWSEGDRRFFVCLSSAYRNYLMLQVHEVV